LVDYFLQDEDAEEEKPQSSRPAPIQKYIVRVFLILTNEINVSESLENV